MNQPTSHSATQPSQSQSAARAGVWLGLGVGLAIGVLASTLLRPAPAQAGMLEVSSSGDVVALTTDGGAGDVLMVIDQRSEQVMVYHVRNQSDLQFLQRYSLRELFTGGKLQFGSRPNSPAPAATPGGR